MDKIPRILYTRPTYNRFFVDNLSENLGGYCRTINTITNNHVNFLFYDIIILPGCQGSVFALDNLREYGPRLKTFLKSARSYNIPVIALLRETKPLADGSLPSNSPLDDVLPEEANGLVKVIGIPLNETLPKTVKRVRMRIRTALNKGSFLTP